MISERTESVVATASKEAHTQVVFVGAWIHDAYDDYLFMIEYQSLGKEVDVEDIAWVLWCVDNSGTLHKNR